LRIGNKIAIKAGDSANAITVPKAKSVLTVEGQHA
jgi:hypothetical protein